MGYFNLGFGNTQKDLKAQMPNMQQYAPPNPLNALTGEIGALRSKFSPFVQGSATASMDNSKWITPILQKQATQGSEAYQNQANRAISDVNAQKREAVTGIRERMAQQGLNSPLGINVENKAYANAENAIGDINARTGIAQEEFKNQAIAKLLGIDQMGMSALGMDRDFFSRLLGAETGIQTDMFNASREDYWKQKQIDMQDQQAQEQMLGQLLGMGFMAWNPGGIFGGK